MLPELPLLAVKGLRPHRSPLSLPGPGRPLAVGVPPFLRREDCRALAVDEYGTVWAVIAKGGDDDDLALQSYGPSGGMRSSSVGLLLTLLASAPAEKTSSSPRGAATSWRGTALA